MSTGIQYFAFSFENISLSFLGSQYLKKYHEEFTKVSRVFASRLASPLHFGHFTFSHFSFVNNGFPTPNLTSLGNLTGKSFSGTAATPHLSQCISGIGVPQYLCLATDQSRSLKFTTFFASFFSASQALIFSFASLLSTPLNCFE